MKYILTPSKLSFCDLNKKNSFSAHNYNEFCIKNKNISLLKDLIITEYLQKGKEVGSSSYIYKSNYFFIRTKALQENYFLPTLEDEECIIPILPNRFLSMDLKEGDILISKDGNIGEVAYLNQSMSNFMVCGGIYRIRIPENIRFYVLAFLKNIFFKEQICNMTSKAATIQHAKKIWLNAKIPFPNQENKDEIIEYISILTEAALKRESEIKRKHSKIIKIIYEELIDNQKEQEFLYTKPSISALETNYRIDAGFYCEDLLKEQFLIENYQHGFISFESSDFNYKRGQNLQVSQIGQSLYSTEEKSNFYKLIRPISLTNFGTVEKYEYLGNPKDLQQIKRGEIIFSAEGSIGKFHVFIDVDIRTITNIHGITIYPQKEENDIESIFLGCFLSYLRDRGVLDYLSVGGQGGSLAQNYWKYLKFPNFPKRKKEEIAKEYYNPTDKDVDLTINSFSEKDQLLITQSGILELDKQMKIIKKRVAECVHKIVMDENIDIDLNF